MSLQLSIDTVIGTDYMVEWRLSPLLMAIEVSRILGTGLQRGIRLN